MRRLLGVEVPDDARGVLQDIHWAAGAFGYFPSYALGCLIAAQLWERLESDARPAGRRAAPRRRRARSARGWASTSIATAGGSTPSRWSSAATGGGIDAAPFLRYASAACLAPGD